MDNISFNLIPHMDYCFFSKFWNLKESKHYIHTVFRFWLTYSFIWYLNEFEIFSKFWPLFCPLPHHLFLAGSISKTVVLYGAKSKGSIRMLRFTKTGWCIRKLLWDIPQTDRCQTFELNTRTRFARWIILSFPDFLRLSTSNCLLSLLLSSNGWI